MSEFIVETTGELYATWYPMECVVRCRDCDFRSGENDQGVDPNYCEMLGVYVAPNGFCAWARRRETDE